MKHLSLIAIITAVSFALPLSAQQIEKPLKLELDREEEMTNVWGKAKKLPATLVVRVAEGSNVVEVAHVNKSLNGEEVLSKKLTYVAVKENGEEFSPTSELDKDHGQESWYFYWGYAGAFFYPSYWYAGYAYAYTPYYGFRYGGYAYSYYRPYYYAPARRRAPYPCCWR
jgi:hypothetical protein